MIESSTPSPPPARPLNSMARWTGVAVLATALLTVSAAGIAFWTFERFERTLDDIEARVAPSLTAALKLSENSAVLTAAAATLPVATTHSAIRHARADLHAAAAGAINTLAFLKAMLSPDLFNRLNGALSDVVEANEQLAVVAEQQATAAVEAQALRRRINAAADRFNDAANRLLYAARSLRAEEDVAAAAALKADGGGFLAQTKAALDQTDAEGLVGIEIALRQSGVSLRTLSERLQSGPTAERQPDLPAALAAVAADAQNIAFGVNGALPHARGVAKITSDLWAAAETAQARAVALTAAARSVAQAVEQEVRDDRAGMSARLAEDRRLLATLCFGGLGLAGCIAYVVSRAVRRHEQALGAAVAAADAGSRAKSVFLANMSHELRTPLNAVVGFADMMKQEIFGPLGHPQYLEYVRLIESSGEHLVGVIGDILDISKIEAGKFELRPEAVSSSAAVEAVVRLVEARAQSGQVGIRLQIAADAPQVYADPLRLKQILLNILFNAVKFTPPGGEIRVGVRRDEQNGQVMAAFDIADTGIGMTAQDLAVALEPFGQAQAGADHAHGGAGLGLPLSKRLAQLSGGDLAISSVKGEGTTVTVALPALTRA